MSDLNWLAVLAAGVAAVVVSTIWYSALAGQMAALHPAYADRSAGRPPAWKVGSELVRSVVLAAVIAWLALSLGATELPHALRLAFLLWIGFPVVLWTGACVWERVPPKLAAIHAADWLIKLIVVTVIVTAWR